MLTVSAVDEKNMSCVSSLLSTVDRPVNRQLCAVDTNTLFFFDLLPFQVI